jgi:hypothetical protein
VFTRTAWDEEGLALRDPDSTTYFGAVESAEDLANDCTRRPGNGWSRASKELVLRKWFACSRISQNPEITRAAIEGPEAVDGALKVTFTRALGTKG